MMGAGKKTLVFPGNARENAGLGMISALSLSLSLSHKYSPSVNFSLPFFRGNPYFFSRYI
jgi:hypothetical protein